MAQTTLFWSGNGTAQGGAGTWDTSNNRWGTVAAGPYSTVWNNASGNIANFGSTAGAVTVAAGGVSAGGLTFTHTTGTYNLQTNAVNLSAGSVVTATPNPATNTSGPVASLATLASADSTFRFRNTITASGIVNGNLFTVNVVPAALSGANANSVVIQSNAGTSTAAPIVLGASGQTLAYTGTTTVGDRAALGFNASTLTIADGSITMGVDSTLLRSGGNLAQATLNKIAPTSNSFTIIANNAGTSGTLNLTNFPNARLAVWDNAGTGTFGFTGAITAGSNGYRFGSSRAGNTINIGGTNTTGAVTANVLSGTAGLTFVSGSTGSNPLNLWGANSYSGDTINNVSLRAISINHPLAMQNSAIDTSGTGTYILGAGSSGTNGSGTSVVTTPTIGGLIGTNNLLTSVIATTGYNTMTSLTLNPGTGKSHTYSGVIANSTAGLSLTKSGAGTQTLSGLNTFAGNVTISGGILVAGTSGNGTNSNLGPVLSTRTINVNTGGTLRFDASNVFNPTFSAPATSLPVLNIAGGTMTNGGSAFNSALGNITLTGGNLTASTGSPIGTGQSGEGWGSWNLNGTVTSTGTSTISSTAPGGIPITLSATSTNGFVTTFDVQSGTLTASAVLGDVTRVTNATVSGLAKTGAGTMVLSGINTYTGNTAINAGVLSIATKDALPGFATNGRYSVAAGATLAVQNNVLESEVAQMLATSNFAMGSNLGFDTSAASRVVTLNLADSANGALGIVKVGTNTLTLSGTNTYTGGTSIQAGSLFLNSMTALPGWNVNGGFSLSSVASLIIPNTVTEAEVTTMLGTTNIASGSTITFDTSLGNRNYASVITDTSQGLLNIAKIGSNTLTLAGAHTFTGNTTVTAGGLTVSGSITGSTATSNFTYGTAAATTNVSVLDGASMTLAALQGGNNAAAVSVYRQSGGTVTVGVPQSAAESAYATTLGYGYFEQTGGNVTVHSRMTVASNTTGGSRGVMRIGGGASVASMTVGELFAISRGATNIGELTLLPNSNVTFQGTGANNFLIHGNNTLGTGFFNIVGGTFSTPVRQVAFGNGTSTNTSLGVINLGAGTLEMASNILLNVIGSGTNRGYMNFSGGTVKLLANTTGNLLLPASNGGFSGLANTIFGPLSNSTANLNGTGSASAVSALVGTTQNFGGGLSIDTDAFSTTISAPLSAPTGGGVAQANLVISNAGAGYVAPPTVVFSNPTAANASPAAGYALVYNGQLVGIVITSPGCYDAADTVTVTLSGGGATTPAVVDSISGATLTANVSGGLAKWGTGTLTLSGANTYTGATAINGGTLNLTGSLSSNITVANNANMAGEGVTTGSLTFAGTSNLGFNPTTATTYLTAGSVNGTAGTVTIVPIVPATGTAIVVMSAAGGITGTAGGVGNNFVYAGRGNLYFNGTNTELLIDSAPLDLVWKGNDGTNPSFWDLNTTTNWDATGAQKFFTNDAVTFDDTASSFVVDINAANIFPGNMLFDHTGTYTVQGAFGIFGGATLTKSGTGRTVILNSNGYNGATTVSAGVLNIRHANALGSTVAGTAVSVDAALEIQGGITTAEPITINGTGVTNGGALRSVSGNNVITGPLELASASQVAVDADSLTLASVSGALGLTKTGTGSLVLTGASAASSVTVEAGTLHVGTTTGTSTTATLGSGTSVTLNGSSNLTLRRTDATLVDVVGAIGGSGSLTLQGINPSTNNASQYNLNNASTYSGGTTVINSRANVNNATAFGTGAVTVGANGGVLFGTTSLTTTNDFNIGGLGWTETSGLLGAIRLNTTTLSGNINLTSNARITGAGSSTISGVISGSHGLDFFEDTVIGTITLSGANTYTGTTVVNSMGATPLALPNLIVANNNALGSTSAGTTVFGTASTTTGTLLSLANGITVTDETLTLDPVASGYRASLATSDNATATWDGNIVLNGSGGLAFHAIGASSNLTVGGSDADTVTGSNSLILRGSGTGTVNSTLSHSGSLAKTDASVWTIGSENNSYPGNTQINSGILSFASIADAGLNCPIGAGNTIVLGQNSTTAGVLRFTGAAGGSSNRALTLANGTTGGAGTIENTVVGQTLTLSGALTVNTPTATTACTLTLTGAGDGVLSGGVVGTPFMAIAKSGAGTWTLNGTYNHTATRTVTAGVLNLAASSVVDSATSIGKFTVNGASAVANIAGTYNVGNGNGDAFFEIRGGGIVNFSGTSTLSCATTGAGFRVGEAGVGTLNVTAGSLTYNSFTGSNFVIGRTSGGNGTVNITGGTLTVAGPGGFIIANDSGTSGVVNISGTGTLVVNSAICRIGGNAGTTSAVLNLNAGGTLALAASPTSVGVSRVFNMDGGTLRANADITIASLTEANIKDGGVVIDSNGNTITINQALLNFTGATTASLTKSGTGTLRLTGANTYSGATSVTVGTLELVGGSQVSSITVSAGASLGFVIGSPTLSAGTFSLSAGKIKITGTPTLNSHDLITSSAGITGTPVLDTPVPGYELKVDGTSLKLVKQGYAAWAGANGAGTNLNDDHDNDGVANGVEYFLGGPSGTTTGFTALPGVTNTAGTLSVTWVMGAGYAGVHGTDFTVETSDTLTGTWNTESSPGTVTISGSNVTYTFPAPLGTKRFARLKVTGP